MEKSLHQLIKEQEEITKQIDKYKENLIDKCNEKRFEIFPKLINLENYLKNYEDIKFQIKNLTINNLNNNITFIFECTIWEYFTERKISIFDKEITLTENNDIIYE